MNFIVGMEHPADDAKRRLHDIIQILEETAEERSSYQFWGSGI